MSTLALTATGVVSLVAGAAAMYIPARLARYDAATYRELAERKLDECEQRDAAYEQSRGVQPFWSFDAPELPAADPHVTGEVLHVEPHETGEHPVVETGHKPTCPDLYYCPTVDEVESGCHGGFDVCCSAPELHQPIPDERDDEDIAGEEQPGEGWFDGLVAVIKRIGRGVFVAIVVPPIFVWNWCVRIPFERISDAIADARQQRADRDRIGSSADDVEERRVEIEAWVQRTGRHGSDVHAVDTGYRGRRWEPGIEHTGVFPIVVPAQRDGGDDL